MYKLIKMKIIPTVWIVAFFVNLLYNIYCYFVFLLIFPWHLIWMTYYRNKFTFIWPQFKCSLLWIHVSDYFIRLKQNKDGEIKASDIVDLVGDPTVYIDTDTVCADSTVFQYCGKQTNHCQCYMWWRGGSWQGKLL